jgi:hypothetical protein
MMTALFETVLACIGNSRHAMGFEESQILLKMRRQSLNTTSVAPNGKFRFKIGNDNRRLRSRVEVSLIA